MTPNSTVHQSNEGHTDSVVMARRLYEIGLLDVMRFERVLRPDPGPGGSSSNLKQLRSVHGTARSGPERVCRRNRSLSPWARIV